MKSLSRRRFTQYLGAASTAALLPFSAPKSTAARKPNILFIMVDDLGKEWIGQYGAEDIETPRIDALAKGGMTFTNAYSMPQCTPSRVSLLTGQYPWRTGWVNHWDVPRWGVGYFDWKHNYAFPRALRDAGYATVAAGKWQINDFRLEPRAMDKHGFNDWCLWTGYESGNPPSGKRYWDPYINTPQGSKTHQGAFGPKVYTDYLIQFMKEHKEQPMFLYFPMALTHGPLTSTPAEPHAETGRDKFKAMVRYTDHCVGRLVDALEEHNLRENTIIVFTTDNGTSRGMQAKRNGKTIKGGKGQKTENGVCAPFIVNGPGLVPQGVTTDALTDFTDLAPTFCELADACLPRDIAIDGHSIAPLLLGQNSDSPREWIMALGHGPAKLDKHGVRGVSNYASRVIRGKRYKVWVNEDREIEKLYDLKHDPFEETNLLPIKKLEHHNAYSKFQKVVDSLPHRDARPKYAKREANAWDREFKE